MNLGIFGAGQLSMYLAKAAKDLGHRAIIFAERQDDPAVSYSDDFVLGRTSDKTAVTKFEKLCDFISVESDFLPFKDLVIVSPEKWRPQLNIVELLSDKLNQRKLLSNLKICQPEVVEMDSRNRRSLQSAIDHFKSDCVLKWSRGGYDGKGVHIYRNDFSAAEAFCEAAWNRGIEVFAERKILFRTEAALVGARSVNGEFICFPLVLSEQRNGICYRVEGPAEFLGISSALQEKAKTWLQQLADRLDYVGVLAMEFFVDSEEIYVNELAPRVHNSGHFSLTGTSCSQFTLHWLAILGEQFPEIKYAPYFSMRNLLGPKGEALKRRLEPLSVPENFEFFWYGKSESRMERKMGHLNAVGSSIEDRSKIQNELTTLENDWREHYFERN